MIEIMDSRGIDVETIVRSRKSEPQDVSGAVEEIIQEVRQHGDEAVLAYTKRFDGVELPDFKVSAAEIEEAKKAIGSDLLGVLQEAADNLRAYHQKQVRQGFVMADKPGVVMGQRILPLERVGLYVPGGTAPYPSTVLMDAIPAKIAGVSQIVMASPPGRDGQINPAILAAASVAGVTDIYKIGGAQAIAALSFGTQTVPRVDKIVGPGNIYVATAKKLVYGVVDIDMIAGPSDILVVADETANATVVAADMLGQAEHDKMSAAVLITTSAQLAQETKNELQKQLKLLERREIAVASIQENGRIILAETLEKALEIANAIAPEHLELCVQEPFSLLPLVKNAGSVFLGCHTPEALGDYFAGPNHTLPTAGTARFYSPLSVDDFIKKSSYLYYSKQALASVADKVISFAKVEGLTAHANSVMARM